MAIYEYFLDFTLAISLLMKKPPCFSDMDSQKLQALDFTWSDMLILGLKSERPYLMSKEV
jgi:hypothetical protein